MLGIVLDSGDVTTNNSMKPEKSDYVFLWVVQSTGEPLSHISKLKNVDLKYLWGQHLVCTAV